MDDRQIADLLARYRPVRPDDRLRARVFARQPPTARAWPWVAAAAVLLAATIGLHTATTRRIAAYAPEGAGAQRVDRLTAALGGDVSARRTAEWILFIGAWRSGPPTEVE